LSVYQTQVNPCCTLQELKDLKAAAKRAGKKCREEFEQKEAALLQRHAQELAVLPESAEDSSEADADVYVAPDKLPHASDTAADVGQQKSHMVSVTWVIFS
jgi:hypothetical protein